MEKRVKNKQTKNKQHEYIETLNVTRQTVLGSAATLLICLHQKLNHGKTLGKPTHDAPESPALCQWGTPVNTMTGQIVGQHLNSSELRVSGWFSLRTEYNVPNQWKGWLTSYCVPTSPCHRFYIDNLKGETKYVTVPNYSYSITGIIIAMLLLLNYLDMAWLCRVSMFWQFWTRGPRRAHQWRWTVWQAGPLSSSFLPRRMCFALSWQQSLFSWWSSTPLAPPPLRPTEATRCRCDREKFYICKRGDCFVCTTWVLKSFWLFRN